MIYKPKTGSMWDPSIFWHEGMYYAIMMYNPNGSDALNGATCGLIAHSKDGVHWEDGWTVTPEPSAPQGGKFFKAFIDRIGDRFVMNHGVVQPNGSQDTLRYYESSNLKDWDYLGSNRPASQWYESAGRWDHMYVIAKDQTDLTQGYYGYPVATPKAELPRGCGLCESLDGRTWRILPPPQFQWGDTPPKDLEVGGVERIDGRFIMIGGHAHDNGYRVHTLTADAATGPFRPDPEADCLCGNLTQVADPRGHLWRCSQLATWARGAEGEKLIANYAQSLSGTWLLPLRKPVFADGHMRLGWWAKNDRLKGPSLELSSDSITLDSAQSRQVMRLDLKWNPEIGGVFEGTITAHRAGKTPSVGIAFAGQNEQWLELHLEVGQPDERCTRIGWWDPRSGFAAADTIGQGCASVAGIDADTPHTFRLLVREGLFELYINDLLVQTYFLNEHWDGTIGFVGVDAKVQFTHLKAYQMTVD